jgi:hypothetical protein
MSSTVPMLCKSLMQKAITMQHHGNKVNVKISLGLTKSVTMDNFNVHALMFMY